MPPLTVHLEKVTPAYAGLGGGSADVAALLRCLWQQYAPEMAVEQLRAHGRQWAAICPSRLRGHSPGRGQGRAFDGPAGITGMLGPAVQAGLRHPTPALFARADSGQPKHRPDIDGMVRALEAGSLEGAASRLCNVFEELLPEEYHEVFRIKEQLLKLGALNAAMSGSGPTVFGIFREEAAAQKAGGCHETALFPDIFGKTCGKTCINREKISVQNPGTACDTRKGRKFFMKQRLHPIEIALMLRRL